MPSKKKKYNARFPAGRIKKIMQSDEEIGKVAQAVPIIILVHFIMNLHFVIMYLPRTLELFIESILTKTLRITFSRNAKTLSPSHMKQCIMLVPRFDFLRELVKNVPDINMADDSSKDDDDYQSSEEEQNTDSDTPQNLCIASTSKQFHHQNSNGVGGNGDDAPQDLRVRAQDLRVTPQDLSLPSTSANSQLQKIPCNSIGAETASNVVVNDELHSVSSTTGLSNISGSTSYSAQPLTNPKLLRSGSTSIINLQRTPHSAHLKQQQQHQSQSVTSTGSRPTNVSAITAPLKKHSELVKQPQEPQPTAIYAPTPAPIVGIDFCSKPIVKIDYSNLQALQITSTVEDDKKPTKPVTAPANLADAFRFNVTPVISIDLSNMVTGEKTSTITTTTADQTKASSTATDKQITVGVAAPISTSITTLGASLIQTSKNNCDLDLDEDYDNL